MLPAPPFAEGGLHYTIDGKHSANQLRLVVYLIIDRDFYIPVGAGFLPSTVSRVVPLPSNIYHQDDFWKILSCSGILT